MSRSLFVIRHTKRLTVFAQKKGAQRRADVGTQRGHNDDASVTAQDEIVHTFIPILLTEKLIVAEYTILKPVGPATWSHLICATLNS